MKDINPGHDGSFPRELTDVSGTVFFTAEDPTSGRELWKSDGTSDGTVRVEDINPGAGPSFPVDLEAAETLTDVGGTLFFAADDGTTGFELWKSDGTSAGTAIVADINPGVGDSSPGPLTNVRGTLYFGADDGLHGAELWKLAAA